jgi:hypothetical protein
MIKRNRKKRLLYVDKTYPPGTIGDTRDIYIREELAKKYDLIFHRHLDGDVIDLIRQSIVDRRFDAMVTHMPCNRPPYPASSGLNIVDVQNSYNDSLHILEEIRKLIDMPIIICSGAGNSSTNCTVFLSVGDDVIEKSTDAVKDFKKIDLALKKFLRKYKRFPLQVTYPPLRTENGYTVTPVRVNLTGWLNFISAGMIFRECKDYPEKILFKVSRKVKDARKFFDLVMPPAIHEGQKLIICVEGTGEEAQRKALRLYAAFSSRDWFTMDPDRFENEIPGSGNIVNS